MGIDTNEPQILAAGGKVAFGVNITPTHPTLMASQINVRSSIGNVCIPVSIHGQSVLQTCQLHAILSVFSLLFIGGIVALEASTTIDFGEVCVNKLHIKSCP